MIRFILLLFILAIPLAHAQDDDEPIIREIAKKMKLEVKDVRSDYNEGCSSGQIQPMARCSYYHRLAADIALNSTYRKLMKQLNKKSAEAKLLMAQKTWLSFRDASCNYEIDTYVGGRGEGIQYSGCIQQFTEERTKQLKEYLSCTSPGCPGDW